jgi:hypothetical protein
LVLRQPFRFEETKELVSAYDTTGELYPVSGVMEATFEVANLKGGGNINVHRLYRYNVLIF